MIAPFMPSQPLRGRRRTTSLRAVMDAILYLLQSGCQWALLPHDFPPKSTVHHYFKRFCKDGTWRRIHDALYCRTRRLEGREEQPSFAIIDSQSVKTSPDARHDIGYDAGKKIKGRKRHILVDTLGMLLKVEVHSAGIQDRDGAALVFDKLATAFPSLRKSAAMAAIRVQRSKRQARDRWRSSNATMLGSRCCQSAGSLSARLHGLASTGVWQRTSSGFPQQACVFRENGTVVSVNRGQWFH